MSDVPKIIKIECYILVWIIFLMIMIAIINGLLVYIRHDSCFDDGICEEGRDVKGCLPDGSSCVISQEVCKVVGIWKDNKCYFYSDGHTQESVAKL
ncbi:MAG: hypothetical protein IKD08_02965 [Alphaproteobacteria bacterium]|nr:hypothetical protein [Alphaproteobacteria bacterium]